MINGKMWLVVKPTVGIPIFFIAIVVASLSIHTAILVNTTWFPAFLQGKGMRETSQLPDGSPSVALVAPGTTSERAVLGVN